LAAYHLPLDGHPRIGNNALLAAGIGCASTRRSRCTRARRSVWPRRSNGDGVAADELAERVRVLCGREPLVWPTERRASARSASSRAVPPDYLGDAIAAGLDAFLTGEPAERVMTQAREAGIHFLAAGHYATETFGVRALGDHLQERFGIEHVFVDDPNPI
jgi:putative NIF3 family GTP cyclohydrolase 1 type 2